MWWKPTCAAHSKKSPSLVFNVKTLILTTSTNLYFFYFSDEDKMFLFEIAWKFYSRHDFVGFRGACYEGEHVEGTLKEILISWPDKDLLRPDIVETDLFCGYNYTHKVDLLQQYSCLGQCPSMRECLKYENGMEAVDRWIKFFSKWQDFFFAILRIRTTIYSVAEDRHCWITQQGFLVEELNNVDLQLLNKIDLSI